MKLVATYAVPAEEDTRRVAETVAKTLRGGETIGLVGELGAGKTTFTRYLVAALGFHLDVSSPSYVLSHEYAERGMPYKVEHWDLYRVSALPEELAEPPSPKTIRLIEWADKFPELGRVLALNLAFTITAEGGKLKRSIKLSR
jgi:tRNA threonylcarbamoyladenosine biosynthesis protein TsaE